jgi:hypothetical protein
MNWERVDAARRRGRALLAVAGFAIVVAVLLLIRPPGEPSFGPEPPLASILIPRAIGIAGVLFGLAWMCRLYKAPTKHEGAHWRFRDH